MGILIELSPEVEALLRADAEAQGCDVGELAGEHLSVIYLREAEIARRDFDAWYASRTDEQRAAEIAALRADGEAARLRAGNGLRDFK